MKIADLAGKLFSAIFLGPEAEVFFETGVGTTYRIDSWWAEDGRVVLKGELEKPEEEAEDEYDVFKPPKTHPVGGYKLDENDWNNQGVPPQAKFVDPQTPFQDLFTPPVREVWSPQHGRQVRPIRDEPQA